MTAATPLTYHCWVKTIRESGGPPDLVQFALDLMELGATHPPIAEYLDQRALQALEKHG